MRCKSWESIPFSISTFETYLAVEKFPGMAAANSKVPYLSSFRLIALQTFSAEWIQIGLFDSHIIQIPLMQLV